jgi:cytochrome c oxidase assembly protein subunit 15
MKSATDVRPSRRAREPKVTIATPCATLSVAIFRRPASTVSPFVRNHTNLARGKTSNRTLRRWLILTALSVVVTLIVGGATRLTESGLSITEWKPVTGAVPPMAEAHWNEAYQQYLQIPEAQTVHAGITLAQFKSLYWWEWAHRLAGRVVGVVVAIPFLFFWVRGGIPRTLFSRLLLLPLLVGAQGVLGWYMVSSGLSGRTSVSPYRLVAHLSLALVIFGIAVWTAASLGRDRTSPAPPAVRHGVLGLIVLVSIAIMSGGFVAGLDAGRIFNEFPHMGGRVVPDGYGTGFRNLFENPIAAQFNHRVLTILTAIATWVIWLRSERGWPTHVRKWMRGAAAVAILQLALGIATLLSGAPVGVAMLHQLGAVALLTVVLLAGVDASDATA